jgi:AraC family transcriptional regulator
MESSAENVLSLNELAAAVRLSPYHFCRAFKDSFGMPPYRYQTLLRLNRARRMLADTPHSVTDIALAVGYESGQALARAFRRELGVSPQAYRRQL